MAAHGSKPNQRERHLLKAALNDRTAVLPCLPPWRNARMMSWAGSVVIGPASATVFPRGCAKHKWRSAAIAAAAIYRMLKRMKSGMNDVL